MRNGRQNGCVRKSMFPNMFVNMIQAKEINDSFHNGNYMKKSVFQKI